jgi:hypothetical protein
MNRIERPLPPEIKRQPDQYPNIRWVGPSPHREKRDSNAAMAVKPLDQPRVGPKGRINNVYQMAERLERYSEIQDVPANARAQGLRNEAYAHADRLKTRIRDLRSIGWVFFCPIEHWPKLTVGGLVWR